MKLIYKNNLGACYEVDSTINPNSSLQLVLGTVGIFMSTEELANLLDIVRGSHEPCNCKQCNGRQCNKIWTTSPLIDICLKVDDDILEHLEDLIVGSQFILNMNSTLKKHKIK